MLASASPTSIKYSIIADDFIMKYIETYSLPVSGVVIHGKIGFLLAKNKP